MTPNRSYLLLLFSLIMVAMVTLSSEAMAESTTTEVAVSDETSTNNNDTSNQTSTNNNDTSNQTSTKKEAVSNPQLRDFQYLIVKKHVPNSTMDLGTAVISKLDGLPLNYSVVTAPAHGNVPLKGHILTYVPNRTYNGSDFFTFTATVTDPNTKKPLSSKESPVYVLIGSEPILELPPKILAAIGFGLSIGIVLLIFIISYILIKVRRKKDGPYMKFWDIVRDDNWYPSLAIFQFILWTGIVLFAYIGIALTRFFSGVDVFTEIPSSLILVMGISAAVPVIGTVVSNSKYGGTTPPNVEPTKEVPSYYIRKNLPGFKTSLMENGKLALPRFQMFAWTWIGIIAYLALLYIHVVINLNNFESLSLPSLPVLLISLMGLSQVTYLMAKSVRPSYFSINEVRPRKIGLQQKDEQKRGNIITVLGSNFGNKGTVWLEYYPPLSMEERNKYCPPWECLSEEDRKPYRSPLTKKQKKEFDEDAEKREAYDKECAEAYQRECDDIFRYDRTRLKEQFNVTPAELSAREDNRISVSLDSIIYELDLEKYVVRVEKEGLLTYANSDAAFDIIYGPPKAEDQSVSTEKNKQLIVNLKAKARDASSGLSSATPTPIQLTYIVVENPSHGTLSNFEPNIGKVTYTPNSDYVGDDSFTFKVNDGKTDGNTANVTISIKKPDSLTIVGRYPEQNMTNVKKSTDVVVNFSESLDSTTVNKVNFIVKKHSDGTNVDGDAKVLPEDDKIAVFNPTTGLESSTAYDVTILAAIQSKDKKKLEKDETWSFDTGS